MMNASEALIDLFLAAAKQGDTDTVITLLERGVAINTKDNFGLTALMYAASNGYINMVVALLERGADVKTKNYLGWMAADFAQNKRHRHVIDIFNSWVDQQALSTLIKAELEHLENGLNF